MKTLIIGSSGKIGSTLGSVLAQAGHTVIGTMRDVIDLANVPHNIEAVTGVGNVDVVYLCAAVTRMIDCEDQTVAYRVNVDAPMEIARQFHYAKIIYLSSEAVERGLHTNYGLHKALAEMGLRTVCKPIIVRLSRVEQHNRQAVAEYLASLATAEPGIYHWSANAP